MSEPAASRIAPAPIRHAACVNLQRLGTALVHEIVTALVRKTTPRWHAGKSLPAELVENAFPLTCST